MGELHSLAVFQDKKFATFMMRQQEGDLAVPIVFARFIGRGRKLQQQSSEILHITATLLGRNQLGRKRLYFQCCLSFINIEAGKHTPIVALGSQHPDRRLRSLNALQGSSEHDWSIESRGKKYELAQIHRQNEDD